MNICRKNMPRLQNQIFFIILYTVKYHTKITPSANYRVQTRLKHREKIPKHSSKQLSTPLRTLKNAVKLRKNKALKCFSFFFFSREKAKTRKSFQQRRRTARLSVTKWIHYHNSYCYVGCAMCLEGALTFATCIRFLFL